MVKLFRNISFTFFSRIVLLIIGLVTNIIIARLLGPSGKGTIALLNEFFFIVSVIAIMGVHEANIYYIGNKQFKHNDIFGNAIYQTLITSLFVILILLLLKNWLPMSILRNVNKDVILIAIWFFPAFFYQVHITTISLGNKNIVGYNMIIIIQAFCILILQIILIPKFSISGAIYGILLGTSVAALIGSLILVRQGPPSPLPNFQYWKSSYIYGTKSQIGLILSYLNRRLPIIIINLFLTTTAVGYYALALTIAEFSWYLPESVGTVLFPEISGSPKEEAAKLVAFVTRNTLFIITIAGVLLELCGGIIIRFFFGMPFAHSILLLRLLIPGVIIYSINRVLCSYFAGTGKPEYGTYTSIVSFVVMMTLILGLVPRIGVVGAPIASTVAFIISSLMALIIFMKISHCRLRETIIVNKEDLKKYSAIAKSIIYKISKQ